MKHLIIVLIDLYIYKLYGESVKKIHTQDS